MEPKRDTESKILIEIPSYRDEQLIATVASAFRQAESPDRVYIAICYQDDDMRDYDTLSLMRNVKLRHVPLAEARGSCYARYLCQQMLEDEEYVLHIDAHMRFCKNWDTEMIRQWTECGDPKAVLSTYAPGITQEMLSKNVTDEIFDEPGRGIIMKVLEIDNTSASRHYRFCLRGRIFNKNDTQPKRNVWISGHFVFARAQYDRDIEFDPEMYFCGDEIPIALRAYTHGYNVYNPGNMYVYHYFGRPSKKMPDGSLPKIASTQKEELHRTKILYGVRDKSKKAEIPSKYGLGKERTLEDFERDAGVSMRKNIVTYRAHGGYYYDDMKEGGEKPAVLPREKIRSDAFLAMRSGTINIIMPCASQDEAIAAISDLKSKAARPMRLKITLVFEEGADTGKIKTSEHERIKTVPKGAAYGEYISKGIEGAHDEEFMIITEPSVRYAYAAGTHAWDEALIYDLISCGNGGYGTLMAWRIAMLDKPDITAINSVSRISGFTGDNPSTFEKESVKNGSYYPLLHDDMLICRSELFKAVPPDVNLCKEDFMLSYSIRLWTFGYDIYHPRLTYGSIKLTENRILIGPSKRRPDIIGFLLGCTWDAPYELPVSYKYGIGDKRSTERWERTMGVDYSRHEILNK